MFVESDDCLFDSRNAGDREVQLVRAHIIERAIVELIRGQRQERRNVELDTVPGFTAPCVELAQLLFDLRHVGTHSDAISVVEAAQVGVQLSPVQHSAPCAWNT